MFLRILSVFSVIDLIVTILHQQTLHNVLQREYSISRTATQLLQTHSTHLKLFISDSTESLVGVHWAHQLIG